ncbi:dienelactone hydrolase family protein [Austwickia chelonae]|uniref:dienelactone hydrolase family protein n=1 Tax=Austwickia chelonae TaxID=100225 RepID=UPI000E256E1A|nr:alpha/beta hydrolase [Austwickia chelonae]
MQIRLCAAVAAAVLGAGLITVPASAATEPLKEGDSQMVAYSFKPGMIKAGRTAKDNAALSRFDGVLTVPKAPGKHPVAVIVHGSYANCVWYGHGQQIAQDANTVAWPEACGTKKPSERNGFSSGADHVRHEAGFAYLAKHLADRGIATVAIDVSTKDALWTGSIDRDKAQSLLVDEHLRLLKDLDAGKEHGIKLPASVKGRLDLSRVALVGHGSGATWAAEQWNRGALPGLKAAVALQPVVQPSLRTTKATTPIMYLGGECDEQAKISGVAKYAAEAGKYAPNAPIVFGTSGHTTHAGLVGGLDSHKIGLVRPVKTPGCADGKLLPKKDMRGQNAQVVGDFLTKALTGSADYSFGIGEKSPVEMKAITEAAKVKTHKVSKLPQDISARSVNFQQIDEQFLPALPAGVKIHTSDLQRD